MRIEPGYTSLPTRRTFVNVNPPPVIKPSHSNGGQSDLLTSLLALGILIGAPFAVRSLENYYTTHKEDVKVTAPESPSEQQQLSQESPLTQK